MARHGLNAPAGGPGAQRVAPAAGSVRRHGVLAVLLAAGLALRIVTQLAYRPALLYIDSPKYLLAALERFDPQGYRNLLLEPVLWRGNLALVAAVQHLLGLAMAVALYAVLTRRRIPRWAAALATAPVLLDAYQLQIEQTIMPDVLFEAFIVTGLAILLWNPRPGLRTVAVASFVLGLSATVRQVGEVLFLPVLAVAVLAAWGWRRRLTVASLLIVSFAIPILAYMAYSATILGDRFQLSDQGDAVLYGRTAAAADCGTLRIPAQLRPLCPSSGAVAALGIDGLVHDRLSPLYRFTPSPGLSRSQAANRFSYRVLEQQPLRVAGAIADDAVKLFALTRNSAPTDPPIWRWQFQATYQLYPPDITRPYAARLIRRTGGGRPAAIDPLATFLRTYQLHGGYTPGPYLLLALLAGLGGIFAARRSRDRGAMLACLLVTGMGAAVLLAADVYEFSWRYQLPALVTLPAAGTLGAGAIVMRIRGRGPGWSTVAAAQCGLNQAQPPVTLIGCRASVISQTSGPSGPGSYTKTAGSG